MKFKKFVTFVSILGMLCCTVPTVSYADNISIKYGKQKINYSDAQVKYTINGSNIKSKHPGIIIDGISLASAKEVFSDSKIGLSYKYNKKKNTLELKRDKTTLVLTLDSITAKVNGKSEVLPVEPRMVEFSDKTKDIYVPTRYVAKTFGLTYTWDASTGVASMTGKTVKKKKAVKSDSKAKTKKDKNNTIKDKKSKTNKTNKKATKKTTTKSVKETFIYSGKSYDVKNKKVIFSIEDIELNTAKLPGVYVGKTLMGPARSLFLSDSMEGSFTLSKSKKSATISFGDNNLILTLGSKNAELNGAQVKLEKAPDFIKLNFSNKNEVYIPMESICELFDIDIETSGNVSTLSLPDDDEDVEDVGDDENSKPTPEPTPEPSNEAEQPLQPFVANKLPFSWKSKVNPATAFNAVQSLNGKNTSAGSSIADIVNLSGNQADNFDTYTITSTEGFSGIKGNMANNQLTVSLDNVSSNGSQSYTSNIRTVNYINTTYNAASNSTNISFGLADGVVGYEMSLSKDGKSLNVKIYKNTITEIKGSYNKGVYTFTFTGLAPLSVNDNGSSDSNQNLAIPNIIDTIGSGSYVDNTGSALSLFSYFSNGIAGASLSVNKTSRLTYYTSQSGNTLTITFSQASTPANVVGATIALPSGLDTSEIEDEDNYFSGNFTITLPGDLRSHFNSKPIKYDANKVSNVNISLNDSGDTVLTFYTTKLYAYRLTVSKSQIKVAIDRAKNLYSKVVVIDPGHGGHDDGTTSQNKIYKEKNVVLSIGYTYFRNYLNDEDLKVYWTRKGDTYPTLYERAAFPKKVDADIFISVHMNSFPKATPKGTEVFYSTRNNILQPNGLSSYTMASMFLKNITSTFSTFNRGVKTAAYVVTNMNTVPAVLLEYGFLSNEDDLAKFSKLENQDKAAEVLYDTIEEIFDNYPTGR
jgi:hypothetical protein